MKSSLYVLKQYFIPHQENDYKPHFFREASIVALSFVVTIFFFGAVLQRALILDTSLFADIFPKVLVELANNDRAQDSLGQLKTNPLLEKAAQLKANDMAAKSYFAHTSPEGVTPWYWFAEAGYDFAYAGENLAVDFSDSVDVDKAWMASPGHRANILNDRFSEIGIATARGVLDGRETIFVVQMFGRAKSSIVRKAPSNVKNVAAATPAVTPPVSPAPVTSVTPAVTPPVVTPVETKVLGDTEQNVTSPQNVIQETIVTTPAPVFATMAAPTQKISLMDTFVSSPVYSLSFLYMLLALLVALGLALMIFIKIQVQHPRNIAYGFGVLALIGFLFFVYQSFVFSPAIIG
jgi:hypothetical protein